MATKDFKDGFLLEASVPEEDHRYMEDDLMMAKDVAQKQGHEFLGRLIELIARGAQTDAGFKVGITMMACPAHVRATAFTAFTFAYKLEDDGTLPPGAADRAEQLMVELIHIAKKGARKMLDEES